MRYHIALAGSFLLAVNLGCSKRAERQWTPQDHEAAGPTALATASASGAWAEGVWTQTCAPCHAATGNGDSPTGKMLGVRDLTSPDWQKATSDETIAGIIEKGRGKMPAFRYTPQQTQSLVTKIRSLSTASGQKK